MDIINLLISLGSGVLGGNISGASQKDQLGTLGNSLAGLIGGGVGNFALQALGMLGSAGAEHTLGTVLSNIGISGLAGAVLPVVISFVKQAMAKE